MTYPSKKKIAIKQLKNKHIKVLIKCDFFSEVSEFKRNQSLWHSGSEGLALWSKHRTSKKEVRGSTSGSEGFEGFHSKALTSNRFI